MLRYSCLQSTVVVAAMALLVLLAVAVNGLQSRPENSRGPMSVYSHEGHAILSRRTPPDSPKPPAQQFDVGTFNLKYRLFLTKTGIDVSTGNPFYLPDLLKYKPTIVDELDLWKTNLRHRRLRGEDSKVITCGNRDHLVVAEMVKWHYRVANDPHSWVDDKETSIIHLHADIMVLHEKTITDISSSPFQDLTGARFWLNRIIKELEAIVDNQMNRLYDVAVQFSEFLLEKKVTDDDCVNFLAHFIHENLMKKTPLPGDSFKALAESFFEKSCKTEKVNGKMVTTLEYNLRLHSDHTLKSNFNRVVYNQSLDHILAISRGNMKNGTHAFGAISAQKGTA